jgi:hypothetical protein
MQHCFVETHLKVVISFLIFFNFLTFVVHFMNRNRNALRFRFNEGSTWRFRYRFHNTGGKVPKNMCFIFICYSAGTPGSAGIKHLNSLDLWGDTSSLYRLANIIHHRTQVSLAEFGSGAIFFLTPGSGIRDEVSGSRIPTQIFLRA